VNFRKLDENTNGLHT